MRITVCYQDVEECPAEQRNPCCRRRAALAQHVAQCFYARRCILRMSRHREQLQRVERVQPLNVVAGTLAVEPLDNVDGGRYISQFNWWNCESHFFRQAR